MFLKVKLYDKMLLNDYFKVLSIISVISSLTLIFVDIPDTSKTKVGSTFVVILFILYLSLWLKANLETNTKLKINNSTLEVKVGDIFQQEGLKVIAFNEYFDTQVDNRIISENTLNGIYIKKIVKDVSELDHSIDADQHLNDQKLEDDNSRPYGKKKKYRLGTIFMHNNYLLTAFTRFDTENRAYLYMNDYINFLLNFWNEIDIIYSGRSVSIPLLGSGITRFKEYNMVSEQELLELLIWSFKISRIKFTYPSKVSIIIHKSKRDKINFFKLRSIENGL